jgi:hypothetical protein
MMVNNKAASPVQADHLGETASKTQGYNTTKPELPQETTGNSVEVQRQRLLDHFQRYGSINTIEARRDLDVLHPAGRIQELRKAGEPIQTIWTTALTEVGKVHRVARYILAINEVSK